MKKFEGILILSDIDGTFLWTNSYIPPRNIERIRYFTENGGHFTFASGRNHKDIFIAVPEVKTLANAPCVLCNGSYLYDAAADEILNPQYLNGEKALELLAEVREKLPQVGLRVTVKEGFLVPEDDETIKKQLSTWRIAQFANFRKFSEFDGRGYFKAVFSSDHETLLRLRPIYEKYADFFDLTSSGDVLFELQPRGISKSFPLPYLKGRCRCKTLCAVGDFDNDAEMLAAADIAASPENAAERIRRISDLHLCHCKDGAIGDLIGRLERTL